MIDFQMYPLGAVLAVEEATFEAFRTQTPYTPIGFEEGSIVALIKGDFGSYFATF